MRHPLVVKLKSGEYNGADIMEAWLLIEQQDKRIAELEEKLEILENGIELAVLMSKQQEQEQ